MGRSAETKIQYWNDPDEPCDHDSNTYWIKDAVEGAGGQFWYKNVDLYDTKKGGPWPDSLTITIDRDRGVVVVSED